MMLVLTWEESHPSEVSVLAAAARSDFSQLLLTALAQEGQSHVLPQDGVSSFSLRTGEIKGQPEPKGPGGDELSAPHLHGVAR